MSRMMPARVRSEGISLYAAGLLSDPVEADFKLSAEIEGEQVIYDLDGAQDFCSCSIFQQNHRYCKHIAAVEEYLKNNENNSELQSKDEELEQEDTIYSENLVFLDAINSTSQSNFGSDQYSLEIIVSDDEKLRDVFSLYNFLYFDLRLRSERLGKSYVIKDLPYFLRALRNFSQYPMGGNWIELYFDNFDEASQDFLSFLMKIDARSDENIARSLFIKNGRYLNLPFLFLEEGMDLASNLEDFTLKISERELKFFSFVALNEEDDLFDFVVRSKENFIELSLVSVDYHSFYDGALLYFDHAFYKINQEQRRLISVLDKQFRVDSAIRFGFSDKDILAQALQQLSTIGKIDAPKYFRVRKFNPFFTFDQKKVSDSN